MSDLKHLNALSSKSATTMLDGLMKEQQAELGQLPSTVKESLAAAENQITGKNQKTTRMSSDTMLKLTELLDQLAE